MNIKAYIKKNPRKLLENLTSYLTIIIAILGILISEGSGMGLTPEFIAQLVAATAILNRLMTYIRITFLKDKIEVVEVNETK